MRVWWRAVLMTITFLMAAQAVRAADAPDYIRDIEPIFLKHCNDCHGVDIENLRESPRFAGAVQVDVVGDHRLLDHAHRHDFEARRRLQLGKVGHRHPAAVDGWLVAEIEERRDRHAAELRERIADDGLLRDLWQEETAPGRRRDQTGRKDRDEELNAKHRWRRPALKGAPLSRSARRRCEAVQAPAAAHVSGVIGTIGTRRERNRACQQRI